jgi:circadian clock protein KaiB
MKAKPRATAVRTTLGRVARTGHGEPYVLRLYVTGMTARATRAIENLREICDRHLAGRYDLEIVDVYQQPALARDEQIVAAPTLIRKLPLPLRRIIGDMSQPDRVLLGLDLIGR